MPTDQPSTLTADELLAADRLLTELLAERSNTVDLGAAAAAHDDLDAPAAATG